MSHSLKTIFAVVIFLLSTGCAHLYGEHGVLKNRETDYLKAQTIKPIKVPAGYDAANLQSNYPVPEKQYPATQARIDLTPPGLAPAAPTK